MLNKKLQYVHGTVRVSEVQYLEEQVGRRLLIHLLPHFSFHLW